MISRRKFLGSSLVASSALAVPSIASCSSPAAQKYAAKIKLDTTGGRFLRLRKKFLGSNDPKQMLGYPINLNWPDEGFLAWQKELRKLEFGSRSMNNVGDPFYQRGVSDSHYLEADLIERFGERFGFAKNNVWGFLSNSGTDSNLHGAYIGRTLLQRRTGVLPKIYYTSEAHYSVQIIRDLLGLEEVLVATNADGSMSVADLKAKVGEHASAPVLIISTIGTTLKGAVDDIDSIHSVLRGKEHYLHLDAALFGGYLHVTEYADEMKSLKASRRRFDSMSVSCHKFFGFNSVAGLFAIHKDSFDEFRGYFADVHDPAYITHVPGTITCSRDPIKPAAFHYFATDKALTRQTEDARAMLDNSAYLLEEMQRHFPALDARRASDKSNTVYFKRIHQDIVDKWILAVVDNSGKPEPSYAHAVIMPHADKRLLDRFLEDLEVYRSKLL